MHDISRLFVEQEDSRLTVLYFSSLQRSSKVQSQTAGVRGASVPDHVRLWLTAVRHSQTSPRILHTQTSLALPLRQVPPTLLLFSCVRGE